LLWTRHIRTTLETDAEYNCGAFEEVIDIIRKKYNYHLPASRQTDKSSPCEVGVHLITFFWIILSYKRQIKDIDRSIHEIYEKHVMDGVDITDLFTLTTEQGLVGLCMDMFLDLKVREQELGQMAKAEK
jgi:hypothetical protein